MKWLLALVVLAVASNALASSQSAGQVAVEGESANSVLSVLAKVIAKIDNEKASADEYARAKVDYCTDKQTDISSQIKTLESDMATVHKERQDFASKLVPLQTKFNKLQRSIEILNNRLSQPASDDSADSDVALVTEDSDDAILLAVAESSSARPIRARGDQLKKMTHLLDLLQALKRRHPSKEQATVVISKLASNSSMFLETKKEDGKGGNGRKGGQDSEDDMALFVMIKAILTSLADAIQQVKPDQKDAVTKSFAEAIDELEELIKKCNSLTDAPDLVLNRADSNSGNVQKADDGSITIAASVPVPLTDAAKTNTQEVVETQATVEAEKASLEANLKVIQEEQRKALREQRRIQKLKVEIARRDAILAQIEKLKTACTTLQTQIDKIKAEISSRGDTLRQMAQKGKRLNTLLAALKALADKLSENIKARQAELDAEKQTVNTLVGQVKGENGGLPDPATQLANKDEEAEAELDMTLAVDSTSVVDPISDDALLNDDSLLA